MRTRKALYDRPAKGDKPASAGLLPSPKPQATQLGFPRRAGMLKWASEVKAYLVPFIFADPAGKLAEIEKSGSALATS